MSNLEFLSRELERLVVSLTREMASVDGETAIKVNEALNKLVEADMLIRNSLE